jgi:hypothetical protein
LFIFAPLVGHSRLYNKYEIPVGPIDLLLIAVGVLIGMELKIAAIPALITAAIIVWAQIKLGML